MRRLTVIFILLLLLYGCILARLFYWQILAASDLKATAINQHTNIEKVPSERGSILSSDGSPLLTNQPAYVVFAEPPKIENVDRFAQLVAPKLDEDIQTIRNLITIPGRKWVSLAKHVDMSVKDDLNALDLKGLGFDTTSMRFYPEASMAAHVLGFVASDADGKQRGYFGIEGFYDRELSGREGSLVGEQDAKGAPMLIGDQTRIRVQNGRTLVLWLDRSIQFIVEKRLKEGMEKYGAKEGTVVVLNPKTGGVLAMASYPNYDSSRYSEFDESLYQNPAVGESYEPGSTFKPLVMTAAINENLVHATTTFPETGPVQIGQYSIKTWNEQYHGVINMTQVLQYSSNVGMVFVSRQLGNSNLLKYIKSYGFGDKSNIDLQDESSPSLRSDRDWGEIDYATSSFGQGIAVTPIQITRAVGVLANDGWLMEPHVVKEFRDSNGTVTKLKEKRLRQVVSSQATREITQMLVDAVRFGEAKWAAPKGYKIAGKTGTAQIPVSGHYDATKTIASFVGYAPADDPQFVMLVTVREPQSSQWGSETAAPLFFTIAKDIFSYMGIAPTQ